MPAFLQDRPLAVVFGVLFAAAMIRGQVIYGLARWAVERADRALLDGAPGAPGAPGASDGPAAGRRAALTRRLHGPGVASGAAFLRRWGVLAVPLAHLTVGFQTLVLLAAGAVRMSWVRFTAAQTPGAVAWATIYSTIGWAAWEALLASSTGELPFGVALLGLAAIALLIGATVLASGRAAGRRRPGRGAQDDQLGAQDVLDQR